MAKQEISVELQKELKTIIDKFQTDERSVRERQIRLWKKMEYYWNGFQRVWWDEVAHDWKTFNNDLDKSLSLQDASYYDRPINVFRAYLESIIAALSATVPGVKCMPDDADDPDDISTARGGDKIAQLVYNHVDAPLLWCKALYIYCTQGMIAAYRYTKTDEEYGTADVREYQDEEQEIAVKVCPHCGAELAEPDIDIAESIDNAVENEFDPTPANAAVVNEEEFLTCPTCAVAVKPEIQRNQFVVSKLVGLTQQAKSRQCIEVEGGLYVFIPNYVKVQKDTPLLGYMREMHYTRILAEYPELVADQDDIDVAKFTTSSVDQYEVWGRLSVQYLGEYPTDTPTIGTWWIRPSTFWMIKEESLREEAKKNFPNGCKVTFINNDYFVCAEDEDLDDHWTIAENPLSNYLHYDPLGLLLTSVQEITNDLLSLTIQTIEHGVPQTFADPKVLDFNQYRNSEVAPGSIYPAKPASGKSIADGFFSISTSSLGSEVAPFGEKINELGQFVSGALPAIWGGAGPASQRTAGQQQMSRNQALQRLQTPWKMINMWWQKIFGKVIPAYIEDMLDDERVVKEVHGTYVNQTIKRAQLNGKLGSIHLDSSDQLPQTWAQIKDTIMQLIQTNNPQILEALGAPQNLQVLQDAIGLVGFNIPGEMDREKQFQEIKALVASAPIEGPDGMPMPSVMPELMVDNHQVEAEICRDWLVGDMGQDTKVSNREGYDNVVAHLTVHIQMLQQLQGGQQQSPEGPTGPSSKGNSDAGRNSRVEQPNNG